MLEKTTREYPRTGRHGSGGGYARRRRRRAAIVALIVCAAVAVVAVVDYRSNAGRIFEGVAIAGEDVGGKTPEEAREVVDRVMDERLRETPVVGGPQEVGVTGSEIKASYDSAASVEEAYQVGREGNVLQRLSGRLQALYGGAEVSPEVRYDGDLVAREVEEISSLVDDEPREATVEVEGAEVVVGESREGYRLDVPATMVEVESALEDGTGEARMIGESTPPAVNTAEAEEAAEKARAAMDGDATISAGEEEWTLTPEEIGYAMSFTPEGGKVEVGFDDGRFEEALTDVVEDLTVAPVDATLRFEGENVVATESRVGKNVDEGELFGEVKSGLFEGRREYEAPITDKEPEISTAEADRLRPTQMLSKYRTDYKLSSDKSEERVENLEIASAGVDSTFLAPGETFSMIDAVGSLDYNASKVIVNGAETKADGGGLCQVTSTLYMAANFAGLDVTERSPHAAQLPYIRPGFDATVWFGDINGQPLDMKFENNTDAFVLLREYVGNDGFVYAEIWGQPNGTSVEMSSRPTMMSDEQSKWTTYQKITKDGKVVYDGVLHRDTYDVLIDEKGKKIPLPDVNVAPVNP